MAAVLAFDFGLKRIGVAVGDTTIGIAHPVTILSVASNVERLAAVEKLVQEWQPASFVIGEPHHENGDTHEVAHLAKKFGNRLTENFKLPVAYVNETLSSSEASEQLAAQGIRGRAQKVQLDAVAAQVILQSYFDEQQKLVNLKAQNAA
jgi:putative Holliday junction resolvase